jgi:hypothetical protein
VRMVQWFDLVSQRNRKKSTIKELEENHNRTAGNIQKKKIKNFEPDLLELELVDAPSGTLPRP